jgi:predicted nucleic acid-binding protein
MITFLDSNALIYYFEGAQQFRQAVVDVLQGIKASDAQAQVAVSRLGVMECRVKPLREGNRALLAQYDNFFTQVQIVELTAAVVTHATDIRATTQLKTPDALQAACALSLGASCIFVTGDEGFARVPGLKLRQVSLAMR